MSQLGLVLGMPTQVGFMRETLPTPVFLSLLSNFPLNYAFSGETIPMSVAVGDRVLMPEWGSNNLELDGQEFHVIRETDIVAKLSD